MGSWIECSGVKSLGSSILVDEWVVAIGTGSSQYPQIRIAREMGYKVLGVDRRVDSSPVDYLINVSTHDSSSVLREVEEFVLAGHPVSGVITRTSGPPVGTAKILADSLSVPSYGARVAGSSISKESLFLNAIELGLPTIDTSFEHVEHAFDYPVVVKPAEPLIGKKNVFFLESSQNLGEALFRAGQESVNGRAIVQRYWEGRDLGVFLLCVEGEIVWSFLYEENVELVDGKFTGLGVSWPVRDVAVGTLSNAIEISSKFLDGDRHNGFVCLSFRLTPSGKLLLYEVNPGLGGDQIASKLMPSVFPGFDPALLEFHALLALGFTGSELLSLNEQCGTPTTVVVRG